MLVGKIGIQNTSQNLAFKSLDFSSLDLSPLTNKQRAALVLLSEEIKNQKLDNDFDFYFTNSPKGSPKGEISLKMKWEASRNVVNQIPISLQNGYKDFESNLTRIKESVFDVKQRVMGRQRIDYSVFDKKEWL